jgi:hypothetical protein
MNKQIQRGLVAVGVLASFAGAAMADVPAGVTTAITSASTDGVTIVGGLAAAGAAVFLIAKVLRKFGVML